jgi:hypothetical protein
LYSIGGRRCLWAKEYTSCGDAFFEPFGEPFFDCCFDCCFDCAFASAAGSLVAAAFVRLDAPLLLERLAEVVVFF